ncbi:MAG: (2Fe-2S)-binding protein [Acidimicrobiia bacterium]
MTPIDFVVNDETRSRPDATELLVFALRNGFGLTGTKVGCDSSTCGACTVLLDGEAVKSCTILVGQAQGRRVTTIEGISVDVLTPIQQAFNDEHGLQCGYCTPGFIMSVTALLSVFEDPDKNTVLEALEGNLCRCTGYTGIINAVMRAAALVRGEDPPIKAGVAYNTPLAVIAVTDAVGEASDVEVV